MCQAHARDCLRRHDRPDIDGAQQNNYITTCNAQNHCEYTNHDTTDWKRWDVWIYVPPDSFSIGSPSSEGGGADERPEHAVTFQTGYFIAKYETTVLAYEACKTAGDCTTPSTADWDGNGWGVNRSSNGRSDHPQNGLKWQQAKDVCAWMTSGGRLPSEAEWESAATGPVHRKYPWGDSDPTCSNDTASFNDGSNYGCGSGGTVDVGTKPSGASGVGALDMSGNVWEWCEDWYHSDYTNAPVDGSAWLSPSGTERVTRGGGFANVAANMRCSDRRSTDPITRNAAFGVRCVRN